MSYQVPMPYKCPKCGLECTYSPHNYHPAPAFQDGPICPKCWGEFIRSVAPVMERVQVPEPAPADGVFDSKGSDRPIGRKH